ncbi:adhesion G protein-coupled receptor E5 isoform X2 [Microcaecilia unicolor]|uniref:CD97 antigen isoform X2 n=1 Tax=Microcaecilia unicolor TaxID=1415580 RepID=A0A6P7XQQ6_9AMPH|nr:CD97 antigen isoform X2 [Microcaecilia unicolor]
MDLVRSLFILGICFSGWTPVAASDKTDGSDLDNGTNNCRTESPCPDNTVCSSWQKDHYCTCKPGFKTRSGNITFTDIKESCDDINECIPPTLVDCGLNAECKNTIGSYHCICLQGYQTKSGEKEFKNKTETTCEDVDKCKNSNTCPDNSTCVNTGGSYHCECNNGYQSTSGNKTIINKTDRCLDVDECIKNGPSACGPNTRCLNTQGSFSCYCDTGFQVRPRIGNLQSTSESQCEDIDECDHLGPPVCGTSASCINTPGSFICTCWKGFHTLTGEQTFKGPVINESQCYARNKCTKINGTNFCACDKGYIYSEKVLQRSNEKPTCLRVRCHSSNHSQQETCNSTNDNFIFCLKKFINSSVPNCSSLGKQPKQGEKLLQDILNNVDKQFSQAKWNSNQLQKHQQASEFLQLMEETAKDFMWLLEDGTTDIKSVSRMSIWKGNNSLQSPINLNQNETRMDLDWETAAGPENSGVAVMGLLTLKDMKTVLSNASLKDWNGLADSREEAEMRVISNVVTAFVSSEDTKNLRSPVNFTFSHQDVEKKEIICAFWNYSENRWSQDGCCKLQRTATETMCTCSHLSSFAVLMAHYTIEDWRLTVITQVGLVISLLCLLFSIITFMFCRILQGTRNTIHLHLCISLFLAYTIFLTGISRTNNQTACSVVAGFLHFFFLASFCWMCLEGVELYRMVVQVFKTHTLKKRYMFLAGYGIPALIVTISAAVNSKGYGTNNYCWLSLEGGFNWSFLAPVCLIVLINAAIFVITVWKLAQKFSTINPDIEKLKKIRTFTITAIAQLCILGLTWIFGIFQFSRHTLVMSYIFTILNCFQGLFIFLLHCLLKKQVREQYHRWFCAVFRLKEPDKYSPFTSSAAPFSSASQSRGNQSSKESGL